MDSIRIGSRVNGTNALFCRVRPDTNIIVAFYVDVHVKLCISLLSVEEEITL